MSLLQRLCSITLVSLTVASVASAQIRSATITGTVTDPTKAVVPGATVVITNQDTNSATELVTTEAGLFSNSYGTRGMGTFNPRQRQLRASLRF